MRIGKNKMLKEGLVSLQGVGNLVALDVVGIDMGDMEIVFRIWSQVYLRTPDCRYVTDQDWMIRLSPVACKLCQELL